MARHRDVRNIDTDDFNDEDDSYGSSYGSSYVDETNLSSSMENYMYRRGGTPKISHFVVGRSDSVPSVPEEDEAEGMDVDADASRGRNRSRYSPTGGMRARSDSETSSGSSSNAYDDLDPEDQQKLAKCLEDVLDIVGDTMPEHMVKEAIVKCDFDANVALNTLLNNPVSQSSGSKKKTPGAGRKIKPEEADTEPLSTAASAPKPIAATSKTVKGATAYVDLPVIKTANEPAALPRPGIKMAITESPAPISNKDLEAIRSSANLAVLGGSDSPSGRSTPVARDSLRSAPSTPNVNMRKGKVDALNEYKKERGDEKDLLNLVVVGHVDSGKSTLMGHLLYLLGQVSSRTMHKYENDSRKLGKQSFAYAWVLDETTEERERGITMDVGQNHFETPHKSVTLLDAPGHKDFIPNMISGAYQADVAVLVVNATRGEFEAGFEAGGQTREHAILVRSLGVSQLVVAVNKLDTVAWSKDRFDEIVNKLRLFLKQVGFKEADVTYVPCSGFTGDNLTKPSDHLASWSIATTTLLHAIDSFHQPERLVEKPFRMSISDIFRAQSASAGGICVAGRIESGFVQKEDRVLVMPLNALANVRQVLVGAEERACNSAFAGEHVSLLLVGLPDQNSLADGMVACDPAQPIQAAKLVRARIVVFNIEVPITRGFPVVLHFGSAQTQAVIKRIVAEINKMNGEIIKNKPRCLAKNCNAIIEIAMDSPVCMELYANVKELGRFMLRSGGKTLAAGLVTEILQ